MKRILIIEEVKMKMRTKTMILFVAGLIIAGILSAGTSAEEYEALKGVKSAKAIFDMRIDDTKSAALHMGLIHQTYKDLIAIKKKPDFVVVFIGPSVKLVSKNRAGFSPEDQKSLDEIVSTVSQMKKDGIKLELCGVAAKVFQVDPKSVLPEIKVVENGWISLIGYEARGYALVPAY